MYRSFLVAILFCIVIFTIQVSSSDDDDYYSNYYIDAPTGFKSIYERKFAYHNSQEDDGFGKAVSIYGNDMLVGACFNDDKGTQAGSAYIFALDSSSQGWKYEATLIGNDTSEYDYFGWSVSLIDGWALIGSWQDDDKGSNSGSAYLFQKTQSKGGSATWEEFQKLYAKDGESNDFFGLSVTMDNEGTALIGAPGRASDGLTNAGVVNVFRRYQNAWYLEDILESSEPYANDYFGISVAIYEDQAVVGAYGNDPGPGEETGAAFVFERNNPTSWRLVAKLTASDAAANDFFGRSVGMFANTIIIGADGNDDAGSSSGSAYVFQKSNMGRWSEEQKLLPTTANEYDYFGVSVAIGNNTILIGADGTTHEGGKLTGSAWFFEQDNNGIWNAILQLNASDNNPYDLYGSSVSIYQSSLLIGAEMGNGYRYDTGAAYVYTIPPATESIKTSSSVGRGVYILVFFSALLPLIGLGWWAYHTKSFSFQDIDRSATGVDDSRTGLTTNTGFWWAKNNEMDTTTDSRTGLNAPERKEREKDTEGTLNYDSDGDAENSAHIFSTSAFNRDDRSSSGGSESYSGDADLSINK